MKALLSKTPGGPDTLVLDDVPEPTPGKGEIRLAIKACSVNFPDCLIIEDKYQFKPARPFAPGSDVAGVVEAIGEGVDPSLLGKGMFAYIGHGGMAEKVVLDARNATPIPGQMPLETAAAFVMAYATSIHALKDRATLKAGETLLVLGAAGGVGLAAVELGKALGARVIAAVSSQAKLDLAIAHGADAGLVYPCGPFDADKRKSLSKELKEAVGEAGADVILDTVGGDYSEPALRAIAWQGRFLVVGFAAGIANLPLNLTLLKGCQVIGVFWGDFVRRDPIRNKANVAELMKLFGEGRVRPEISATYKLSEGGKAIAALADRTASGKLVVKI